MFEEEWFTAVKKRRQPQNTKSCTWTSFLWG